MMLDEHLSFPISIKDDIEERYTAPPQSSKVVLNDRLFIGNLHPSVDEYTLLQIFSAFGKVTKLDFLFHKTGLLKGKPRGYAFVEYGSQDEALKALSKANDKLLRGRKLIVTFANQAPVAHSRGSSIYGSTGGKYRKTVMETGKPTTLSFIKTAVDKNRGGTRSKIAMMEAKLRQMEASNPPSTSSQLPASESPSQLPSSSTSLSPHPSLPLKPSPAPTVDSDHPQRSRRMASSRPFVTSMAAQTLMRPKLSPTPVKASNKSSSGHDVPLVQRPTNIGKVKLTGVRIKPKEREKKVAAQEKLPSSGVANAPEVGGSGLES